MFLCGAGPLIMAWAPRPMSLVLKSGHEQPFRFNLSVNKRRGRKQNESNKTQTAEQLDLPINGSKTTYIYLFIIFP